MTQMRVRCSDCGSEWTERTARFCGRCGSLLQSTKLAQPRDGSGGLLGGGLLFGGVCLLVVIVAVASYKGESASPLEDGAGSSLGGVELLELPPERAPAEPPEPGRPDRSADPGHDRDAFDCKPRGCEAWRLQLPEGRYAALGDAVVHADSNMARLVSARTGELKWSQHHTVGGTGTQARPQILDDEDLLLVTDDGSLELRKLTHGELRWGGGVPLRDGFLVEHVAVAGAHAEVLVVAAARPGSEVSLFGISRGDGEVLWQDSVARSVLISSEALIVQSRPGEVSGRHPVSGQVLWSREVAGTVTGMSGDGVIALASRRGVEVLDPLTGQVRAYLPRPIRDGGPIRLDGSLLSVNAPVGWDRPGPRRTTLTVADATDGNEWVVTQATGIQAIGEVLVVASQIVDRLHVRGFRSSDGLIWEWQVDVLSDVCCWTLEPALDEGAVYIVPPLLDLEPVRSIEAETGGAISHFRALSEHSFSQLHWSGGVGIARRMEAAILVGPGGSIEVDVEAELLVAAPYPVVSVSGGLLGLEADMVIGETDR